MASGQPKTRVELRISCTDLKKMDLLSKSDPAVVVQEERSKGSFSELGRTEVIRNNSNPSFTKTIEMDYFFEQMQNLQFVVYDCDDKDTTLKSADLIGTVNIVLGEILSSPGSHVVRELSPKGRGSIQVIATEITAGQNEVVTFKLRGSKLDKKDFFGKSDPYFVLLAGGTKTKLFQSEVIKNTLDPVWKTTTLSMWTICKGDPNKDIDIEVYDWDSNSDPDLIGKATTTLAAMQKPGAEIELINSKKVGKSKYKNSGVLIVDRCDVVREHSFLEFISGGCEINFTVAIDFTASNGQVNLPTSLHFQNPYKPNDYMQVLYAVGNIISYYDSDKMFPAFGFGGQFSDGTVSHDFALNGMPTNPYCAGIPGIVAAYQQAILNVKLYGPTNFAPIIRQVARFASQADQNMHNKQTYFVLLIITDGIITDLDQTREVVVTASTLPMSIIIVGVGNADFKQMEFLDSDNFPLKDATGRSAARDIVQFVPFNQVASDPERLAKEVLAEIPQQLVSYMKTKNISPRPIAR